MACRLFSPSHYLNKCCSVVDVTIWETFQRTKNKDTTIPNRKLFKMLSAKWWSFFHSLSIMTSSNGNILHVIGPLWREFTGHRCLWGEFTGHRWIPLTKASDADIWCFFDRSLNKRLRKQSIRWWFETPSRPLWRHCYVFRADPE